MKKIEIEIDVQKIAAEIKTLHAGIMSLQKQSLEHAIKAGSLLAPVSVSMNPQSRFARWCKKECGFSYETAMAYIRVARNKDKLPKELNYTEALKALRKTRKTVAAAPERQFTAWETHVMEVAKQHHLKGNVDDLTLFLEAFGVKEVKINNEVEERTAA